MIERSRVRIPAGAVGEFSSPGSTFCDITTHQPTNILNFINTLQELTSPFMLFSLLLAAFTHSVPDQSLQRQTVHLELMTNKCTSGRHFKGVLTQYGPVP